MRVLIFVTEAVKENFTQQIMKKCMHVGCRHANYMVITT